jgi:hypothetical protein
MLQVIEALERDKDADQEALRKFISRSVASEIKS